MLGEHEQEGSHNTLIRHPGSLGAKGKERRNNQQRKDRELLEKKRTRTHRQGKKNEIVRDLGGGRSLSVKEEKRRLKIREGGPALQ